MFGKPLVECPHCRPPPPPPMPTDPGLTGLSYGGGGASATALLPYYANTDSDWTSERLYQDACLLCQDLLAHDTRRVTAEAAAAYELGGLAAALKLKRPSGWERARARLLLDLPRSRANFSTVRAPVLDAVGHDGKPALGVDRAGRVYVRGLLPALLLVGGCSVLLSVTIALLVLRCLK